MKFRDLISIGAPSVRKPSLSRIFLALGVIGLFACKSEFNPGEDVQENSGPETGAENITESDTTSSEETSKKKTDSNKQSTENPSLSISMPKSSAGIIGTSMTISPTSLNAAEGQTFSCSIKSGGSSLPNGLSIDSNTCVISGTPTSAFSSSNIVVVITSSNGESAEVAITISIAPQVPSLSYIGSSGTTGTAGVAMTVTPSTLNNGGGTINSCQVKSGTTALPSGLSVASTTCVISGTPANGLSATQFTIIAQNEAGSSPDATVTLTINADSDNDGIPDSSDQCPGEDDNNMTTRYKDSDNDGFVIASGSNVCAADSTYTLSASDVSQLQLDNPDPDDSTPVVLYDAYSTTEDDIDSDFDEDTVLDESYAIYLIGNPEQWLDFADSCTWSGTATACADNVILVNHIDFAFKDGDAGDSVASDGKYTTTSTTHLVGQNGESFTGIIDGNGYTIQNFNVDLSTVSDYVGGISGSLNGGAILKNIGFTGDVSGGISGGNEYVGGLVGSIISSTIKNSFFSGTVSAPGGGRLAGIAGSSNGSTITNTYNSGDVNGPTSGNDSYFGGIVGFADGGTTITYCYNTGDITAPGRIAGIVGEISSGTANIIRYNYNTGTVSHNSNSGGGIVGHAYGTTSIVSDNYNLGTIQEVDDGTNYGETGGIVAYMDGASDLTIQRNYNAGNILGVDSNVGGVVGYTTTPNLTKVSDNFFLTGTTDSNLDGVANGSDNDVDDVGATAISDSAFKTQATFTAQSWDFAGETANGTDDIWNINEGVSYPYLNDLEPPSLPGI